MRLRLRFGLLRNERGVEADVEVAVVVVSVVMRVDDWCSDLGVCDFAREIACSAMSERDAKAVKTRPLDVEGFCARFFAEPIRFVPAASSSSCVSTLGEVLCRSREMGSRRAELAAKVWRTVVLLLDSLLFVCIASCILI